MLLSEHGWEQHERCGRLLESLGYDLKLLVDGTSDGNYVLRDSPHQRFVEPFSKGRPACWIVLTVTLGRDDEGYTQPHN